METLKVEILTTMPSLPTVTPLYSGAWSDSVNESWFVSAKHSTDSNIVALEGRYTSPFVRARCGSTFQYLWLEMIDNGTILIYNTNPLKQGRKPCAIIINAVTTLFDGLVVALHSHFFPAHTASDKKILETIVHKLINSTVV